MHLLFEESSSLNEPMIAKCLENVTDADFIMWLQHEEIYDAEEFFDINK